MASSPCGSLIDPNTALDTISVLRRYSCSSSDCQGPEEQFSSTSIFPLISCPPFSYCLVLALAPRHLCLFGLFRCAGFLWSDPCIPLNYSSMSCSTKVWTFALGLDSVTLRGTIGKENWTVKSWKPRKLWGLRQVTQSLWVSVSSSVK